MIMSWPDQTSLWSAIFPKYDVFLSFRGQDTGHNFVSHLHSALRIVNILTFIDDSVERGDEISLSLLRAIEESSISVIIFFDNFATSRWCLKQLVKKRERKNTKGQVVILVFYRVDPSDVRHQTGSFTDAFAKHEERMMNKITIWS